MKSTLIGIVLTLLLLPTALFAQSDGTVGSDEPPAEVPREESVPQEEVSVPEDPAPMEESTGTGLPSETSPASEPIPATSTPVPPAGSSPQPAPEVELISAATGTDDVGSGEEQYVPSMNEDLLDPIIEEVVPRALQPWIYMLSGALGAIIALLGTQEVIKKAKRKGRISCQHCKGSGYESSLGPCTECNGKGTVEEGHEQSIGCTECKGEGEELCAACKGEGTKDGVSCDTCGGDGVRHNDEGEAVECGICKGEGEVTITAKRQVPCAECDGTGTR
jgi:hypothetical protein